MTMEEGSRNNFLEEEVNDFRRPVYENEPEGDETPMALLIRKRGPRPLVCDGKEMLECSLDSISLSLQWKYESNFLGLVMMGRRVSFLDIYPLSFRRLYSRARLETDFKTDFKNLGLFRLLYIVLRLD